MRAPRFLNPILDQLGRLRDHPPPPDSSAGQTGGPFRWFSPQTEFDRALNALEPRHRAKALEIAQDFEALADAAPGERRQWVRNRIDAVRQQEQTGRAAERERATDSARRRIASHRAKILPPGLPALHFRIDKDRLTEKAKARLNIHFAEEEIQEYPPVSRALRWAAASLLLLSGAANYLTLQAQLGSDWLGGDALSMTATLAISLLLVVAELVGFHQLVEFLPGQYKSRLIKTIGILGACLLILGLGLLVTSRLEIGASSGGQAGSVGTVQ